MKFQSGRMSSPRFLLRNLWCQQDALWTVQYKGGAYRIWTAALLSELPLSTCFESQLSGWHLASHTACRSKSTRPLERKSWTLDDDGEFQINWMTGAPALVVLEFFSSKCKKSCKLPSTSVCKWTVLYSGLYTAGLQQHEKAVGVLLKWLCI